jgi:hypothetical protein
MYVCMHVPCLARLRAVQRVCECVRVCYIRIVYAHILIPARISAAEISTLRLQCMICSAHSTNDAQMAAFGVRLDEGPADRGVGMGGGMLLGDGGAGGAGGAGGGGECLDEAKQFIKAAERGDAALLHEILQRDPSAPVRFRNDKGESACHRAALEGHAHVVELLCKENRAVLELCTPDTGQTPCHFAARATRWTKHNKSKTMPVLLWISRHEPQLLDKLDKMGKSSIEILADNLFEGAQSNARQFLSEQTGRVLPSFPPTRPSAHADAAPLRTVTSETEGEFPFEEPGLRAGWTRDAHESGNGKDVLHRAQSRDDSISPEVVTLQTEVSMYSLPGNQVHDRREYVAPHSHTDTLETWRKEYKLIRSSLETVFGSESSSAMLKAWGVDETVPKLLAVDPDPTQGGKPVGYEKIGRGQKFIDALVKVSKEGNNNGMEDALDQVPPDCTWVHLPVYRCLALACSRDDGEDVRESLLRYAKDMIERKQWDPAVLLSASRAAQVQGWSSSTRHILLALYQVLFPKQAMVFMSRDDHLFWENSGISDSASGHAEPTLLSEKAVASKKQGVEDAWTSLKREFDIQSASMDDLMKLTGLQQVKLEAIKTVQKLLLDQQLKKQQRVVTTCNFAFMGNPGTGVYMRM